MVTAMIVQGHDDQFLSSRDIEVVRASVKRTRRQVLGAALATPLAAAGVMYLLVARQGSTSAALFVAAVFLGLGVPVFVGWWRRYRRVLGEIEQVEMRIRGGEEVRPSSLGAK
ncbi:hypothetical protein GCM10027193_21000 [Arenimonas aestuarii]